MNTLFTNLKMPSLISIATVLPFILLEILNRSGLSESFPYFLFGTLWIVMLIIVLTLKPIFKNFNSGVLNITIPNAIIRAAVLTVLGYFWISIIIDQMPCFLGGTNCD
ncbi:MAG: hypothetical protein ACR2KX_02350 [Chitinophagaceae bacterium]